MFRYSKEFEKYISDRRKKVIDRNNDRIKNIKDLTTMFGKSALVNELTLKYVDATERCTNEIYERPESTISLVANLRFLFETCITTRLLVAEDTYKYKVRYSIYKHQIEKSKALREYSIIDINRLNELEKEEKIRPESKPDEEFIKSHLAKVNSLYDELDEEISLFLDNAELNGSGYHKHIIESYIEKHESRESDISSEWETKKKELLNDEEADSVFGFCNQTSKVEKELKDSRSWKQKAEDVKLTKMYNFIYDYTSSLIHSTSYSILVPNQLDESEITMVLSLATRLNSDILKNLKLFSGLPNMLVINADG
tara:strand:- start:154 stop:1089 length:936 start_codon:yes stop_codon:yes gene_type:complete